MGWRIEIAGAFLLAGERAVALVTSKDVRMFYKKNVPAGERIVRVVGGCGMVACGLWGPGLSGGIVGHAIAISGVIALLTGFIGFCPMCAMVGRRLDGKK